MLKNSLTILRSNFRLAAATFHSTGANRSQCIEVIEKDGIREIILNEPKTRNSLSVNMMATMKEALCKDLHDEKLRCIVLSAKGPVWSAGHNLKHLAKDENAGLNIFDKLPEIILSIYKAPVPVIAKVNGLATAAGCQLVASCDMVVCSDKSTFSTPGANFGLFCSTPGIAIGRVMPRLKSAYMVMTGLPINAQDAYIAGLVSVVVPEDQLDAEMKKITDAIITKSRAVIALGKQFYYKQLGMNIKDAYIAGTQVMSQNVRLADGQEGLKSFIEKRPAKWTHV